MDPEKKITVCHHILQTIDNEQSIGNLYLGGVGSLKHEILSKFNISAILTVMDEYMFKKYSVKQKVENLKINEHLWLDLQDDEQADISALFERAHEFIGKTLTHNNVLVHCQAGVSRSATIVISYIMKIKKMSLEKANKFVVSKRYQVSPNQGFWESLKIYEKQLSKFFGEGQSKIDDPQNPYNSEQYNTKFGNHIVSLYNPVELKKGNLFLGQATALKDNYMKKFNISSVLTLIDQKFYKRLKIKQSCEHLQVRHKWIDIKDTAQTKILPYFGECYDFLQKQLKNGNVFVHCQAGVSRSATIVIMFLMRKYKATFQQSFKLVSQKRPCIRPNTGFQFQLMEYQNILFEKKQ